MKRVSHFFLLGVALGLACSNRDEAPDEPDRVALCATHCSQIFGPCNPDPPANWEGPSSEEECNSGCVDDPAWSGECRFKYAEQMTCTTDLGCDEFRMHQSDSVNSPCSAAVGAWSSCVP